MKHPGTRTGGFTLIEIMIVVAIIGLLASIAVPHYGRARRQAHMAVCIQNLKQLDGAITSWALENRKDSGQPVQYRDISGYLKGTLVCPSGGTTFDDSYQITAVDEPPTCRRMPAGETPHKLPQ